MVHVGVDLHKRVSQIAVLNEDGEIQQHRVSNEPEQISRAFQAVPKGTPVAIEATGTGWWFVDLIDQMGYVPVLSNPKQTRAIASARLKNDSSRQGSTGAERQADGWDWLKVHPGLTRDEYDAMARTAHALQIPFAGHVPSEVGLLHALEMRQQTIDHLDGYIEYLNGQTGPVDEGKLREVADQTHSVGAWVVPTMALWETIIGAANLDVLKNYPELKYIPAEQVKNWIDVYNRRISAPNFKKEQAQHSAANRKNLLKVLNQRGVPILFGTDAPQQFSVPGFSIHRETRLMFQSGMTPFEIIRSATKNVGDYFKDKDRFGTIQAGQRANLILLDANPVSDLGNLAKIAGVMVRGRWLSKQDIDKRLAKIAESKWPYNGGTTSGSS